MGDKKSRKIPTITPERLDSSPASVAVPTTKEDLKAQSFVKGKENTQPFTIRIPIQQYKMLREVAFNKNIKINHIIIKLIRDYLQHERSENTKSFSKHD